MALNVRTGKFVWGEQLVPADNHDWDLTHASPLYRATIGGLVFMLSVVGLAAVFYFGYASFFVLKKVAFKPIQKTIDDRRDGIRQAVEEADNARNEARELLEQNRAILAEARAESGKILADAGASEGIVSAEIDPTVVRSWRKEFPALEDMHWRD